MRKRAARALPAIGLIAALSLGLACKAGAVEAQKADPEQCADEEKACVEAWYKEYAAGLLGELKYYAGFEDFLAEMLADPQATLLNAKLSLILVEGGTRYSQWALLKDEDAARNAGLDMPRYQAIIGPCREAISDMRTALFDLRQHRENVRAEAAQYLKSATACEKAFALPARLSKLRSGGKPLRPSAPGPEPATPGPMEITPGKPPP